MTFYDRNNKEEHNKIFNCKDDVLILSYLTALYNHD